MGYRATPPPAICASSSAPLHDPAPVEGPRRASSGSSREALDVALCEAFRIAPCSWRSFIARSRRPCLVRCRRAGGVHRPAAPAGPLRAARAARTPGGRAAGRGGAARVRGGPSRPADRPVGLPGRRRGQPIISVPRGFAFQADLTNRLGEVTTTHWHGLQVDWRMDGHPQRAVPPGTTYRYRFPITDRAGTYWYHPHPHGNTARQVYQGLASFLLVDDEDDRALREALDLTLGETDIPLLLQDKTFDTDGQLVYEPDWMGYQGDTVLVNLTPNPVLDVASRIYRFRLLNGSNARLYRLSFVAPTAHEPMPFHLIGTDGGLLDRPQRARELFLSPGERADVLLDLRHQSAGDVLALTNLPFDPMHHEGGPAMEHMSHGMPGGQPLPILKLRAGGQIRYERAVPATLSRLPPLPQDPRLTRPFVLSLANDPAPRWLINGVTYALE
ncbi:MAG: multicopper oxidase domain-containing protein [Actinobacteria bacterium]|nr:multicopper oxidase domain-containing protein [Actinomycetota bacterium]